MALKLKHKNMPLPEIAELTGLSLKEIQSLQADNRLQGSMYDKVFRESMLQTLPGIIERDKNLEEAMMTISKYFKEENDPYSELNSTLRNY